MNKNEFLCFLSAFELSHSKISKILEEMDEKYDFDSFQSVAKKVLGEEQSQIAKKANEEYFSAYMARLKEKGISILTSASPLYPQKLTKLDDPPHYLFYKGDISLLERTCVSIVGTRSPSNYGVIITERFASALAKAGAVIVSGLAYGVDGIAHRKALANGKTIAILAGGFDKVYPAEHTSLFEEIAKSGLVLSEHRPDVKVAKYTFLERNRIVAALADALVITEAGAKSGTNSTKDFALECGVPVYAVPGNITSPKSDSTNALIASMQGICLISEKSIIEDLGLQSKPSSAQQLSVEEAAICSLLASDSKTIDDIAAALNTNIARLNSLLTAMEIKGIIKRMPGGIIAQI